MQQEADALRGRGMLVSPDRLPIGIHPALGQALATDEGETRRPRVIGIRGSQSAADSAAVALLVHEEVPVFGGLMQVSDQRAAGSVGRGLHARRGGRDHAFEGGIVRHFN